MEKFNKKSFFNLMRLEQKELENNYIEPIVSEKIDEEIKDELEEQVEEKIEVQKHQEKEEQTIEIKPEFKENEQVTEQKETEIVLEDVEKVDSEL